MFNTEPTDENDQGASCLALMMVGRTGMEIGLPWPEVIKQNNSQKT
jgi:hypothetical protein